MIFLANFGILLASFIAQICSEDVLVQVEQGWLSGDIRQSIFNESASYYSFKGIPYAKPPVGPLRFKDPQLPEAWDGIRNATEHGAICPQVDPTTSAVLSSDEDCLFLNVYTPQLSNNTLMPVLVFIHGGEFKIGSGNVDNFGPDILINNKGIVIVTMNYRMDALGFLSMDNPDVPGNAGLKDQVYALRWVQRNIKNFGGDPDQVTLQGQSAGATSVALHVLSPMSKGLFQRAQIFSGNALSDWALTYHAKYRAFGLTQDLGLITNNDTEALAFLRNVTSDKLINLSTAVLTSEVVTEYPTRFIPFVAVVEKDFGQEMFLPISPLEALLAGNVNVKEIVTGYTNRETMSMMQYNEAYLKTYERYPEMFVPRQVIEVINTSLALDLAKDAQKFYFGNKLIARVNMEEFINLSTNMSFVYNTYRFIKHMPVNTTVYFYKFAFVSDLNYYSEPGKPYNMTGASHTDDLMYIWYANSLNKTLTPNTTEYELVSVYSELCANFIKYGNPTPDSDLLGFTWTKHDLEDRAYLDAQNILSMGTGADEEDVEFWGDVYQRAGLAY